MTVKKIRINAAELEQIELLLHLVQGQYKSPCDEAFLLQAKILACQLPVNILRSINEFRLGGNHNGVLVISGFSIDDRALGVTPATIGHDTDEFSAIREGFFLMLLISFLGDAFGWASQREGALINNILPVKSHEHDQLSTGSVTDLDWHTEEAFHPFRADYLALMCLRNHDSVPTQVASIADVQISDHGKKILFQPRYVFETDKNFQHDSRTVTADPVLFGGYDTPFIRIDPSFMRPVDGDTEAAAALEEVTCAFKAQLQDIPMEPGDVVFLDNYRVVHGRRGFVPRFDGTDRWLKRVNITLDLRKSRAVRRSNNSRVIEASI